jgi:hypothetical protein
MMTPQGLKDIFYDTPQGAALSEALTPQQCGYIFTVRTKSVR